MANKLRFIPIPHFPESSFEDAFVCPDAISFMGKMRMPDGSKVPLIFLHSGMKVAISDETFEKVLSYFDLMKETPIPDAFTSAWPEIFKKDDDALDNGDGSPV